MIVRISPPQVISDLDKKEKKIQKEKQGKENDKLKEADIKLKEDIKNKKKNKKFNYGPETITQNYDLLSEISKENPINEGKKDLNELPYNSALLNDKRNIFQIFYSILIMKIEIINILFISESEFKLILISQYILSLLIQSFFNSLLYSDDVISNKYHNNGDLDIVATLTLSLLSNIITSIITYYLNYSKNVEETFGALKKNYALNDIIFLKILKIKFFIFLMSQMVFIFISYYYLVIFFIIFTCIRNSIIISYLTSLLENLITSITISLIITIFRKLAFVFSNKIFYNISKYINDKF